LFAAMGTGFGDRLCLWFDPANLDAVFADDASVFHDTTIDVIP